jgi:uncharacterized protein (TIGR03067 family)
MVRHWLSVLVIVVAWLNLSAQGAASEKDKKALQGKWKIVTITIGDRTMPASSRLSVTFERGKAVFTYGEADTVFKAGTFTIDAGKTPKALDLKGEKASTLYIYELNGDDLKLCWIEDGGKRPSDFSATAKNGHCLYVLKRAK